MSGDMVASNSQQEKHVNLFSGEKWINCKDAHFETLKIPLQAKQIRAVNVMRLSQLLWCSWSYATEILCDDYE